MSEPSFVWDPYVGRYRSRKTGRFISEAKANEFADSVAGVSTLRMQALTERLNSGKLSLTEWQLAMAREMRVGVLTVAALGSGGFERVKLTTPSWAEAYLRYQYGFLQQFAKQIARGEVTPKQAVARAAMYGHSIYAAYQRQRQILRSPYLFLEERRVLNSAAEHCGGCISQAAQGWQPKGVLAPIGSQECKSRCRCHFEFRRSPQSLDPCSKPSVLRVVKAS